VIPEWATRHLHKVGEPALIVPGDGARRVERSPKGIYDLKLLCKRCEHDHFEKLDNYGAQIIRHTPWDLHRTQLDPWTFCYDIMGVNTTLFRKFLLSVIWRLSQTSRPFADKARLSRETADSLRTTILNTDSPTTRQFVTVGYRLESVNVSGIVISGDAVLENPSIIKATAEQPFDSYHLPICGFVFVVALTESSVTDRFESLRMDRGNSLLLLGRRLTHIKRFHRIVDAIAMREEG
jgi:hypothetical protein